MIIVPSANPYAYIGSVHVTQGGHVEADNCNSKCPAPYTIVLRVASAIYSVPFDGKILHQYAN